MPAQDENYWSENDDPYLEPATKILKNIPNLKTIAQLEEYESLVFQANFPEALETALNSSPDLDLWKDIHRICFKDIYEWAGNIRTIRVSKGTTVFAYPEHIENASQKIFDQYQVLADFGGLTLEKIADTIGELNVIHPFREGNGRTLRILLEAMCAKIGHDIDYGLTDQNEQTEAFVKSYQGDNFSLTSLLKKITKIKN